MSFDDNRSLWRQLPGNVWRVAIDKPGYRETHHTLAMKAITRSVNFALDQRLIPEWSAEFVETSLLSAVTIQFERNNAVSEIADPPIDDSEWEDYMEGRSYPDRLVRLRHALGSKAAGKGFEIARLTHVGIADTEDLIDAPVRKNLVNEKDIDTTLIDGQPYYKVKYTHQNGVILERKRMIMTHLGDPFKNEEKLWTMRRDMYLVDYTAIDTLADQKTTNPVVQGAIEEATEFKDILLKAPIDQSRRNMAVTDAAEPIVNNVIDLRAPYVKSLLTTLYLKEPTEPSGSAADTTAA